MLLPGLEEEAAPWMGVWEVNVLAVGSTSMYVLVSISNSSNVMVKHTALNKGEKNP